MRRPSITRGRGLRRAGAGLLAGALLATAAASALGHAELLRTSPRDGATVRRLPGTVTLTFEGPLGRAGAVKVLDARGTNHVRVVRLNPRNARQVQVVTRPGPGGAYRVSWAVTSADGHRERGAFRFRVSGGS